MKLYTQRVAPNPTKVELYLAEKAAMGCVIPLERVMVNLMKGEQRSTAIAGLNGLQRVPFLELDDGRVLPESLAIIEYFEERWPEPTMIGTGPDERARVRALERSIDSDLLYAVAMIVHASNSPAGYPPNRGVVSWFSEAMKRPLAVLNKTIGDGRAFVAGARPTIADCSLAAALQFARFGKLQLPDGLDHIAAWNDRYRARDAVKGILIF
jgi:glutathione S-transferase